MRTTPPGYACYPLGYIACGVPEEEAVATTTRARDENERSEILAPIDLDEAALVNYINAINEWAPE